MKKSLLSLLFVLFNLVLQAQTAKSDTIITARFDTILCTINIIDQNTIYYTTLSKKQEEIALKRVFYYVKQPIEVASNTNLPTVLDGRRLPLDSVLMSQEINYMKTCFTNFHKQYKQGVTTTIIGMTISGTGGFLINKQASPNFGYAIVGLGSLTSIIGGVMIIDSHKWMGRAGLGITGNGIGVRYIFK